MSSHLESELMATKRTQSSDGACALGVVRGGFSLVEILVVVVIAMIMLTISIPAYQALIASSERSLAVNSLQSAVQAAQDIALDGREGEDGAIVFLVSDDGRLTMIPAVKIGNHREVYMGAPGEMGLQSLDYDYIEMEVFAPVSSGESIQLPESWFVRGYAPIGSMVDKLIKRNVAPNMRFASLWYNSPTYGGSDFLNPIKDEGNWVFPETNMYARDAQHAGGDPITGDLGALFGSVRTPRQSFMVRFDGRSGQLSRSTMPALFINPRVSRERPFGDQPLLQDRWKRVDLADNIHRWGVRMTSASDVNSDGQHWSTTDLLERSLWMGNVSHDTVLVKAVTRIALYNETDLANDLGARGVNRITRTIYKDYDQLDSDAEIEFDLELWPTNTPTADDIRIAINRWIEGDTNGDGRISFDPDNSALLDEPRSRLFLIGSYSGKLQEVLR